MTAVPVPEIKAAIARMYREGYGVQQIANRLGMEKSAVLKVVHRL